MRLIDADALIEYCNNLKDKTIDANDIARFPTVDVLQKLWNALYAEEDKLEKKYVGTPEHDKWFMVYRPWLQDGFGIAIRALSDTFTSESSKEGIAE